ncbi:OmpA family protein [Pedobacter puniceum]|uniref:OmpA family protein n=1 Tax=Pedobacter puniceum TaxID=2666136 RepID=A0A7K0FJ78_9SPHI|nr:OmpA family protein [Pedobacter puniceum]MRX45862.1 OmpA family protein [Pedobacter puniceum]
MKFKNLFIIGVSICMITLGVLIAPKMLKSDDLGKANKYYEKYDYKFAIDIYEKLLEKSPNLEVAQKLANCYRFVNNTIAAERAYATVLTFPGFDPINYIYYAGILKQNGKFDQAKRNYLMYAERVPEKSDYAVKLANSCDAARLWLQNPDVNVDIENENSFNSEHADFSPIAYANGFLLISDRWFLKSPENDKNAKVYGWTGNSFLKIYQAEQAKDSASGVMQLTLLPEQINDKYHNGPATLNADGSVIYFTRAGMADDADLKHPKDVVFRKTIYIASKRNGVWSQATPFPYNSPYEYSVQHPALSADGNILYFASDMPGGFGGMDLYYSEKSANGWSKPINCGNIINSEEDEVFPFVRKDGTLYFSSRGHITIGGLDIFSSKGEKNTWKEPENLKSPYNSTRDDFGIFFFQDNLSGYLSSNRPGGKGSDDIYRFYQKPKEQFFAVEGKVTEKGTGNPLSGLKIFLINKKTGEEKTTLSAEDGSFKFSLEKETDYTVRGDMDKFFSRQEGDITTKGATESTVFNVKFEVEKVEEAYLVRLKNIYYDFNKYNIRKDAEPELNKVVAFLNNTPSVNIELRSHTDARGKAAYNLKLSELRAASAKDYLKNKGIAKERLSSKGFGETQLLNTCADGAKCSEEQHQLNRRTEFKVVKVSPVLSYLPAPLKNFR